MSNVNDYYMHTPQSTTYTSISPVSNASQSFPETTSDMQYDFPNISSDFFQPESMFPMEQIRPSDMSFPTEPDKSPTTVLDLGSGTIQRSSFKIEPQEPIWEFNSSPVKQEENSNSVDYPLGEENYTEICNVTTNPEFANNFFKNIDSSCQFPYTTQANHSKAIDTQISNYTSVVHVCPENRLSCEHASYSGYSSEMGHYDEKFPEAVYNPCDSFPDIDIGIPQLDYSTKSVSYSNVSSLDNSGIMEEESVFSEYPTSNHNEHDSHSCYSQSNFQSYNNMFLPQHH